MEKKHLTYSRRALRQFGGVDPSIRALEKDALATSKLGFTIKDSHAAATCYRDAQKMQKEASKRAGKHSTWLRNLESSRQDTERTMLNRSLSICMEEFDQEWKHKKVIMEAHCEHLLATVRERAEAQRHYLEKKYEVERILPVKYSSATRDAIKQGVKLAAGECYDEVIRLHSKLDAAQKQEEELWLKKNEERQEAGRRKLEALLQQEWTTIEEKVSGIRSAFVLQHHKAKDVLLQRCKNLTQDMNSAFSREWHARPEVAISAKVSNKSRIHVCSTFAGSLLQQQKIGSAFDLPSVCCIHFGDAELVGTSKDYAAVHEFDVSEGPKSPPRPHFPARKALAKPSVSLAALEESVALAALEEVSH
jgi:phage gpG-like protein